MTRQDLQPEKCSKSISPFVPSSIGWYTTRNMLITRFPFLFQTTHNTQQPIQPKKIKCSKPILHLFQQKQHQRLENDKIWTQKRRSKRRNIAWKRKEENGSGDSPLSARAQSLEWLHGGRTRMEVTRVAAAVPPLLSDSATSMIFLTPSHSSSARAESNGFSLCVSALPLAGLKMKETALSLRFCSLLLLFFSRWRWRKFKLRLG